MATGPTPGPTSASTTDKFWSWTGRVALVLVGVAALVMIGLGVRSWSGQKPGGTVATAPSAPPAEAGKLVGAPVPSEPVVKDDRLDKLVTAVEGLREDFNEVRVGFEKRLKEVEERPAVDEEKIATKAADRVIAAQQAEAKRLADLETAADNIVKKRDEAAKAEEENRRQLVLDIKKELAKDLGVEFDSLRGEIRGLGGKVEEKLRQENAKLKEALEEAIRQDREAALQELKRQAAEQRKRLVESPPWGAHDPRRYAHDVLATMYNDIHIYVDRHPDGDKVFVVPQGRKDPLIAPSPLKLPPCLPLPKK